MVILIRYLGKDKLWNISNLFVSSYIITIVQVIANLQLALNVAGNLIGTVPATISILPNYIQ